MQRRQGNVIHCSFGSEMSQWRSGAETRFVVEDINNQVAEIDSLIQEIAETNASVAEQAVVNTQMLLDAITMLDSIAFQSNLFAHELARGLAGEGIDGIASDVQSFVSEGSEVLLRLHSLVCDNKQRIADLAHDLKEIGSQVATLELITSTRIVPACSQLPAVY